jgi:3-deoxy-D-manno-octulosonate 8-phosphate phosphatase (KDO 8-P phosphatase)
MIAPELTQRLTAIKLLAFDVDGVLTDGGIWFSAAGDELVRFDVHDGAGFTLARRVGLRLAVITGRDTPAVRRRMEMLSVDEYHPGIRDKGLVIRNLRTKYGLGRDAVLFMGDDLLDLPAFAEAGVTAAPASAVEEVRRSVDHVAVRPGGAGAAREVVELVLKAQARWEEAVRLFAGGGSHLTQ